MEHFLEAFRDANVDGALAASVFHKQIINIGELKTYLADQGVEIRYVNRATTGTAGLGKNRRITAGGCAACGFRRSADAGVYEPGRAGKNTRQRQSDLYSRTKQRLWTKGETSGHFLNVVSITPDCDNDTLLVLANPIGPTCHKGTSSCFGEASHQWLFLYQLEQLLAERKTADPESSYTAKLYASGTKRIAQKVGEEGVETALAATVHDREELTNEASDLMYHLLVLLQDQELDLTAVIENLRKRHK